MKLGLVGLPFSSRSRPLSDTYEQIAELVILADQLGFAEAFVGEHHTSVNLPVPAPLSFLASLIPRTTQIRLGAGVVALPYHHPAAVAGEVAQLDHLSRGRLNFGIGPGGLIPDMELFRMLDPTQRSQALIDSLDAVLALWEANAPFEIATEQRDFRVSEHANPGLGLGDILRPLQRPHPPIFVTAMSQHSASLEWAFKRGWSPISAHFCSWATLRTHGEQLRRSAAALNRESAADRWRIARHVVVRESASEAEEAVFSDDSITRLAIEHMWQLLLAGELTELIKPDPAVPDTEVTLDALLRDLVMFGSPTQVAEQLRALRDDVGGFGALLVHVADGSDTHNAGQRQTLQLLTKAVLPNL